MDTVQQWLGKTVHVVVDRPVGYCHKETVYPINYGYIPDTLAGDGEPQDAYILGVSTPLSTFDGQVVAIIHRLNDCEDKLVVAPTGTVFHQGQIREATQFIEQYFESRITSLFRKSCGVLPYREKGQEREYLLVFEEFSQCWSLPKGHMEAGETEIQTALRELKEETGLTCRLDPSRRAVIEYPISPLAKKQVVFFLGRVTGVPKPQQGEIARLKWVTREALQEHLFPDTVIACEKLINSPFFQPQVE